MNIELLTQTLEKTDNPGLDTFDPRFTDITSLVEDGNYESAAAQAEEILAEGVYDIRIIGYFLYGVFLEQGVGALASMFQALFGVLTENWEAIGPVKNRAKHAQNSLKWFAAQLSKKLESEEKRKDAFWNTWVNEVSSDNVQDASDALDKLQRSLSMTLEDAAGPVLDGLMKVKAWLKAFHLIVYKEPEPEPEQEVESEQSEVVQETAQKPVATTSFVFGGDIAAQGSYHLQVLLGKLAAFESLIQSKKFSLAALVADDINKIVAKFDPKIYFPKIFAKFSFLFAKHISEIMSFEQYKGTVEWMALQELYKVDLESFAGFDADIQFSSSQPAGGGYQDQNNGYQDQSGGYSEQQHQSQDDDY